MTCLNSGFSQSNFIGHCCEWIVNQCTPKHHTLPRRFDGYLVYPEYGIMICPNFSGVDILALGKDSEHNLDEVWHAVIDEETSVQCEKLDIQPSGANAKICNIYSRKVIWNGSLCLVNILVFQQVNLFDKTIEKGRHPRPSDLKDMLLIDEATHSKYFFKRSPLFLVIGLTQSTYYHCLLLRCSEMPIINNCHAAHPLVDSELFKRLSRLCGRKGIEANRRGGSSGVTDVTPEFFMLSQAGFFPKKQSALKLFQKRLTWTGVYIGGSLAKSWEYGQPQLGGAFKMKKEIMRDSIVLQQFVLFKMQAADIIQSISKQISPTAVCLQLQQNKAASKLFKSLTDKICYVSLLNNFTFVGHSVGYHKDTFKSGVPVLENKICFYEPTITNSTGRGGKGPSKFVWALLDW